MRPIVQRVRLLASSFVSAAICAPLLAQNVVEFPIPTPNSRPYTIVAGPDGNLWFTESVGNKIGRITPSGVITEFPVPTAASGPYGIALGPDGNIWFTERFGDKIGKYVMATGQIVEYPIPTSFSQPWEIIAGPDGNLWFTEEDVAQIGRITPAGAITEFSSIGCCFPTGIAAGPDGNVWYTLEIGDQIGRITPLGQATLFQIQTVQVLPWDITAGPDGSLWFTELAGRAVGTITPAGQISEHSVPGQFSGIAGVAPGPDGNLWFTENDTHKVGGMTPTGALLQSFPTGDRPLSIALGPDGNMWFTEADANKIGKLGLAQAGTRYVLSTDFGFVPRVRNAHLGETVQWTFLGPNVHSVVDSSSLALFASGAKSIVSYFTHAFIAAGIYAFKDGFSTTSRGGINVPVRLPSSGNVGIAFPVTWASQALPAGLVEDVLIQVPGSSTFVPWTTSGATSAPFTPSAPGSYSFRARLRNPANGGSSFYSTPAVIVVQ